MLVLCLLTSLLAGCGAGGGQHSAGGNPDTAASPEDGGGWSDAGHTSSTAPSSPAREHAKIILEGQMDLQTQDFDLADAFLRSLATDLGGYLEAVSISGEEGYRYAEYTARIPQAQYDGFFVQVGEQCHVRSSSSYARNVTEDYVDLEARLTTQRTKHSRLLALLEKADNMESIVALQTELSSTEYEIERMTGSLRKYDSLIDFSTVELTLQETRALDPISKGNSFASDLTKAFQSGTNGIVQLLRGTVLLLVMFWPAVLILAAAGAIVLLRIRRAKARHKAITPADQDDAP